MIRFYNNNFLNLDEKKISSWLFNIAKTENYSISRFDFNFVDKDFLLNLNKNHLNHNFYTDILTFDYSKDKKILAEAFISYDALKENAKKYMKTVENEALRVICHGLLHCMDRETITHV